MMIEEKKKDQIRRKWMEICRKHLEGNREILL
jgi:hypothetical protein